MRDRQISVRRVVNKLAISKSSVLEIMNNYLDMSKVCTRWVPKLLIPIQRMNRVECCQELLQEIDANLVKFLDRIVTGDEFWIYQTGRGRTKEHRHDLVSWQGHDDHFLEQRWDPSYRLPSS